MPDIISVVYPEGLEGGEELKFLTHEGHRVHTIGMSELNVDVFDECATAVLDLRIIERPNDPVALGGYSIQFVKVVETTVADNDSLVADFSIMGNAKAIAIGALTKRKESISYTLNGLHDSLIFNREFVRKSKRGLAISGASTPVIAVLAEKVNEAFLVGYGVVAFGGLVSAFCLISGRGADTEKKHDIEKNYAEKKYLEESIDGLKALTDTKIASVEA